MADIIVTEFVSLDGVMEAPGGEPGYPHSGWVFPFMGPEQMQYKLDEVMEGGSLLIGRVTYESFAAAWPERDGVFADKMNAMPKHVVSTTLKAPDWNNCSVIASDVEGEVRRIKAAETAPILVTGSRTLAQALFKAGLVDELRLMVMPVVLGSGFRLWPETPDKTRLRLTHTQGHKSGVVILHYRVGV
jgi:dihydrofolate reductase